MSGLLSVQPEAGRAEATTVAVEKSRLPYGGVAEGLGSGGVRPRTDPCSGLSPARAARDACSSDFAAVPLSLQNEEKPGCQSIRKRSRGSGRESRVKAHAGKAPLRPLQTH